MLFVQIREYSNTVLYSTVLYSTVLYSTVLYSLPGQLLPELRHFTECILYESGQVIKLEVQLLETARNGTLAHYKYRLWTTCSLVIRPSRIL